MEFAGIGDEWKQQLVGFGCDGTSVNIAAHGVKGYLQEASPWVEVFWCLAHRLELSLKDALNDTLFQAIDETLLRVYYVYEKSPKKCRELECVVEELRSCLDGDELPKKGGQRQLRACGTRFIAHKVAALERLIDRLRAYISHLTMLADDTKVKSVNRQKMKGYMSKWSDARMILGSTFFHDLLRPAAILCKALQRDEVCVISAIESILKTSNMIDKLKETAFEDLRTVKKVMVRITEESGSVTYQCVDLKRYEEGLAFLKSRHQQYMDLVQDCLRDRVKVQSVDLLTLTILATHGWERSESTTFGYDALESLCARFLVPLENAEVDCSRVKEEWNDLLDHVKRYLNLSQEEYAIV